jgi:photosystem II stability/assembly factor-like uncharacterized protein
MNNKTATLRLYINLLILLSVLFLAACNKSNTNSPPVVPASDTLGTGWRIVLDSLAPGVGFEDIHFHDSIVGYAIGNGFWRTSDGGINWTSNTGYQGQNLTTTPNGSVFIVPLATVNGIYKSTDGGNNFSTTHPSLPDQFSDIFFTGNDTGYISTNLGLIRSIDAGNNWMEVSTTGLDSASNYYSMFFFNDGLGWICDSSNVYKTDGNINTWTKATIHTKNPFTYVYRIYATSPTNIYLVVSSGEVYKSTDGGANFFFKGKFSTIVYTGYLPDMKFTDDNTGYISYLNRIYKTADGGNTWQAVVALAENFGFTAIYFTDANHGWACAQGRILKYQQ